MFNLSWKQRSMKVFIYIIGFLILIPWTNIWSQSPATGEISLPYLRDKNIELKPNPQKEIYENCKNCHTKKQKDIISDYKKLSLAHGNIKVLHGNKVMACNYCHDINSRNHLINNQGHPANFKYPSGVCHQCHAETFNSWKSGLHGKRTGGWNHKKLQIQCLECHNSHSVKFEKMQATAVNKSNINHSEGKKIKDYIEGHIQPKEK